MTTHDSDSRALVQRIQEAWTPPPTDPRRFDAQLRSRLRAQGRQRTALVVAAAAAVLLVAASHLLGGGAEPAPTLALPQAVEETPAVASAGAAAQGVFWSEALDHDQRGFSLPGAYGALDTLFLQPTDQEL